jgi:hypothetical protein
MQTLRAAIQEVMHVKQQVQQVLQQNLNITSLIDVLPGVTEEEDTCMSVIWQVV